MDTGIVIIKYCTNRLAQWSEDWATWKWHVSMLLPWYVLVDIVDGTPRKCPTLSEKATTAEKRHMRSVPKIMQERQVRQDSCFQPLINVQGARKQLKFGTSYVRDLKEVVLVVYCLVCLSRLALGVSCIFSIM